MKFSPAQLSEIDAVDVVSLKGINPDRVSEYMPNAVDSSYVRVTGNSAQQIAGLWRQLPSGMQSRCHVPPFGLRFYNNDEIELQASICWECDNIFGDAHGNEFYYSFDAQHETSQRLLALCKQTFESKMQR